MAKMVFNLFLPVNAVFTRGSVLDASYTSSIILILITLILIILITRVVKQFYIEEYLQ